MKAHLLYLRYVLRHKWFVFLECLKYGLLWRGIKHDWTKFLPSEWFPYANYFYGRQRTDVGTTGYNHALHQDDKAFNYAWNHHQKRNSHHWQYWLLNYDSPKPHFTVQSYDGGMSHAFIADNEGNVAAVLYDDEVNIGWLKKPNRAAQEQLRAILRQSAIVLEMPLADAQEMLADWRGAGKAQGKPNTWEWYGANKHNIQLHPNTRAWVEAELARQKEISDQRDHLRRIGVPL